MTATVVVVEKDALAATRWIRREPAALVNGDVRLGVDSFALTSNHITCVTFGDGDPCPFACRPPKPGQGSPAVCWRPGTGLTFKARASVADIEECP